MIKNYDLTVAELFESYYDCRKHKRNKPSSLLFEMNLIDNAMDLYHELSSGLWTPRPSSVFVVTTPKPREVWAADFRDRIVHHLIYRAIGPAFEKSFIVDTCACIKGRGTLYAANRLESHILSVTENWSKPAYILKMDIANFFGSIAHDALFDKLLCKVSNPFLVDILLKLVYQDVKINAIFKSSDYKMRLVPGHKSLLRAAPGIGLPIGNLSSQFFANVYLDSLDQSIKRKLKMAHYVRYVDDMVIVHPSASVLNDARQFIESHLNVMGMTLADRKTSIHPSDKGIDFVGHVIKPHRKEWRPKSFRNAIRKIAESSDDSAGKTTTSYLGMTRSNGNRTQHLSIAKAAKRRGLAQIYTRNHFKRAYLC